MCVGAHECASEAVGLASIATLLLLCVPASARLQTQECMDITRLVAHTYVTRIMGLPLVSGSVCRRGAGVVAH